VTRGASRDRADTNRPRHPTNQPDRRASGTPDPPRPAARALTKFEWTCLIVLTATSFLVLVALTTKGRPLSGADGLLASDQLQYFAWVREAAHHGLIGNPFDLRPSDRVFLHPGFLASGGLHDLTGLSIPASFVGLWKPIAIGVTFTGTLLYVRRLLPPGGQRNAGLILALFAVMPASALVAWTGWGGKPREYSFDFISGEMWSGQYLWGYLMTAIAVFLLPLVLLGIEHWRVDRRPAMLAWSAAGALTICWLQPWQGATLALIVVAVEALRAWRNRERPAWPLLVVLAAVALPAAYYLALGRFDPSWDLAGRSNAAGAQPEWRWPWWAMLLTVGPLAIPAALAYRPSVWRATDVPLPRDRRPAWQSLAVRVWPLAALAVYLAPVGTFPYHAFQGLAIPLGILAVQGVVSVWPHPNPIVVAGALALMTIPGFAHKVQVAANSIHTGGDPYYVFPGEVEALKALEHDPRPGGVLGPTYAGYMIPYRTGRESYIGPFSWTPDWKRRHELADDLFEGRLRGPLARAFVASTNARFVFEDCRPRLADVTADLRPMLARVRRFGCATIWELRYRPSMSDAAGAPDA
jgi:hypothetical protein